MIDLIVPIMVDELNFEVLLGTSSGPIAPLRKGRFSDFQGSGPKFKIGAIWDQKPQKPPKWPKTAK